MLITNASYFSAFIECSCNIKIFDIVFKGNACAASLSGGVDVTRRLIVKLE